MAFNSLTVNVGGLTVGVSTYANSATVKSFAKNDYIVRFTGGKSFNFPDPSIPTNKGRVIELVNNQNSIGIVLNTPQTSLEAPVTLFPRCSVTCVSDGELWRVG
jgi:hypothetical protein